MKTYKLIIVFDDNNEEVEYIEETIDSEDPNGAEDLFHYANFDLSKYFDEDQLKMLGGCYYIGLA